MKKSKFTEAQIALQSKKQKKSHLAKMGKMRVHCGFVPAMHNNTHFR